MYGTVCEGVIYERGFIAIYHDWCEGFSTYSRIGMAMGWDGDGFCLPHPHPLLTYTYPLPYPY